MKIEIVSTEKIEKCFIKDTSGRISYVDLGKDFPLVEGWYELNVEYDGVKNEFSKIILNDVDLGEIVYTGYYQDGQGKIHQPATAVWDEGGCFKLWFHTNLGVLFERTMSCLRNGDYGKNLFTDYQFTCDLPIDIDKKYPKNIRDFFSHSDGPYWWYKKSKSFPYAEAPLPQVDKTELIQELNNLCTHSKTVKNKDFPDQEYDIKSTHPKCIFDLPFPELDLAGFPNMAKLLNDIGMEKPLSIGVNSLAPGKYFHMHRDDDAYSRKGYQYLRGCKVFYWVLTDPSNVHFKFAKCGLLPIHKPLFVNPTEHVHSVVNQSEKNRIVLNIAGKYFEK